MKSIAIIPARGGSVRIPKKNIKPLNGVPLIEYTIKQALDSNCFDRVIVSTDDSEIMLISILAGAEVYHRPKPLAEDVESELVVKDLVETLEKEGYFPDIITMLQPTSPFRKVETIEKCINELKDAWNTYDSVITVNPISQRPEWMGYICNNNLFYPYTETWGYKDESSYNLPKARFIKLVASQELPKLYNQNGCIYTFKCDLIINEGLIIGLKTKGIIIDEYEAFDLDTILEWKVAEELMREKNKIKKLKINIISYKGDL